LENFDGNGFNVVIIPDTQYYSENNAETFNAQTQWIADNKVLMNIQMVLHEGDIVNNATIAGQWTNANAAMAILDNSNVPYLAAIGNHDYALESVTDRTATDFNTHYGQSRYTGKTWWNGGFYEVDHAENAYNLMTIGGNLYLFLSLEFGPRDAVLAWADGIIAANPTATVIIVSHSYLFTDGSLVTTGDAHAPDGYPIVGTVNNGDEMWAALVDKYANISMIVSGHHIGGQLSAKLTDIGENANIVNMMFANWQEGGGGWMRLLTINPVANTVRVQTISPVVGDCLIDADNRFTWQYKAT
jgi:hypothetical protein